MAVHAKITQFHAADTSSGDALIAASYAVVDTLAGTTAYRTVHGIACPTATPGTWKALIIQAVIEDAALAGYTLTAPNVSYLGGEPGDYKYPQLACAWTKDAIKTDIGVTAVNIYPGNGGEGQFVDFSGFKQGRFGVFANKVGTGNLTHRLTDVNNAANIISQTYTGPAGEFTQDSGWLDLPAWANGEKLLKPQAYSSVASDDPVYRQFLFYLR